MDNFGFLKVAAAVPHVRVADCDYNTERMAAMAEEAARRGVEIVAFPSPLKESYVGDEYCDIISRDVYLDPHTHTDYERERKELIQITDSNKITALAEVGTYPDVKALEKIPSSWAYYMLWSKEFCSKKYNDDSILKEIYSSDFSVTLDKLPKLY